MIRSHTSNLEALDLRDLEFLDSQVEWVSCLEQSPWEAHVCTSQLNRTLLSCSGLSLWLESVVAMIAPWPDSHRRSWRDHIWDSQRCLPPPGVRATGHLLSHLPYPLCHLRGPLYCVTHEGSGSQLWPPTGITWEALKRPDAWATADRYVGASGWGSGICSY